MICSCLETYFANIYADVHLTKIENTAALPN